MAKNFTSQLNGNHAATEKTVSARAGALVPSQAPAQKKSDQERQNSKQRRTGGKTLAKVLAISLIPLAVLAVEITVYYYVSHSFEQIDETQSAKPKPFKLLLPMLLIGTGAAASGVLSALWASRILHSLSTKEKAEKQEEEKKELIERRQFLIQATKKLRAALNPEELFQTAVAEARQIIAADRVVVYSLDQQSQGQIIAESVDIQYPRALGAVIDDPCMSAYYLEKYQNGRVQAIDDIEQANLTPCHLAQLQPFAVKANLVAPILTRGKIMGLLIAHHCAAPHPWQPSEIDVIVQIAQQLGLVLENANLLTNSASFQQQKATETKRIESLTKATAKIRASVNQKELFHTAVAEARQIIAADRVVIYSLDRQSQGQIIAESVDLQYPRALGAVIDDPCMSAYYLEKYQNGRVQAIDDIYRANLTDCHLAQLEPFAVKANLVAPILTQGKIMGLLIAHHCAAPHTWQPSEIDVIVQIAQQVGLVFENTHLLTNSTLLKRQKATETQRIQSLTTATEKIRTALNPEELFQTAVAEARKIIAADRVVVYSLDEQSQGHILAESVDARYPKAKGAIIDDPCMSAYYLEKYQNGRIKAINDIDRANLTHCHLAQLKPFAVKANLVVPILKRRKIMGLLIAHHCAAPHAWQPSEIDIMVQIAQHIGWTIDNAHMLTEVAQVSQALLEQLPAVADLAQVAFENVHQAQIQVQQTSQTIKAGFEVTNQTMSELTEVQDNIAKTVNQIEYLDKSSRQICDLVTSIEHLATQINLQGMNILIQASKTGNAIQSPLTSPLAKNMNSLREDLTKAKGEIQSLVSTIATEVKDLNITLKDETDTVVKGTDKVEATQQKLNQIDSVTEKMSMLLGNIINAVGKGVEASTSTSQAILGTTNLGSQNLVQFQAVADSLHKLVDVYQQAQASSVPQEHNHPNARDNEESKLE